MISLFEAVPYLIGYKAPFLILVILCLIVLIQNFLLGPLGVSERGAVAWDPASGRSFPIQFSSYENLRKLR